jgi:hypothetical protein
MYLCPIEVLILVENAYALSGKFSQPLNFKFWHDVIVGGISGNCSMLRSANYYARVL